MLNMPRKSTSGERKEAMISIPQGYLCAITQYGPLLLLLIYIDNAAGHRGPGGAYVL